MWYDWVDLARVTGHCLLLAPRLCLPQLAARDGILSRVDHDGVIDWKHFPRYWPFVRGIHRSLVNSPHKVQWRGALTVFFDVHLYKRLSKLSIRPWFKTPSRSLWCHCNAMISMPYAIDACGHIYASVNLVIIGAGITVIRRSGHCDAHASIELHALFTWATLYHFSNFSRLYLLWDWHCGDTKPSGTHWWRHRCDRWLLRSFMTVVILPVGLWWGRGSPYLAPHAPYFADHQRCDILWQTNNPSTSPVIRHGWFPWPPEPVWYGTAHDCQHSQWAPSAPCGVGRTLYWQLPPSRPSCW